MDLLAVIGEQRRTLLDEEDTLLAGSSKSGKLAADAKARLDAIHVELTDLDAKAAAERARQTHVLSDPAVLVDGPNGGGIFGGGTAVAFPSADGAQASWGRAFIDARQARIGFGASLLEGGSTAVAIPMRPDPIADPRRAKFLFELLPEQEAPGGLYSFLQQSARSLAAAVVATGGRKPTSTFSLLRVNDNTKVIAHITEPIDRFSIEDAPMLQTFIDDELRLGVNLALDEVVVDALVAAATPGEATLDLAGIRTAITALQLLEMEPTAIAINPTDWQAVEAEAVTTFAANSNAPAATEALKRFLYGVPVTVTNAVDDGTAIVGDFAGSALLYRTGDVRIDVTDAFYKADLGDGSPGSTFAANQLVFRGERRANIAVARPAGFVLVGTLPGS